MNINEIKELMAEFNKCDISLLDIKNGDLHICMEKSLKSRAILQEDINCVNAVETTARPVVAQKSIEPTGEALNLSLTEIKAPLVGTFYTSPSPDKSPFVQAGDSVNKGDIIGLIEAMKMMSEIKSPFNGTIKEILIENEAVVGFGDVVMKIEEL